MIFHFSIVQVHFVFIELHCNFSISYKILWYFLFWYLVLQNGTSSFLSLVQATGGGWMICHISNI